MSKLVLNQLDSYQVLFYMYGIGVVIFAVIILIKTRGTIFPTWTLSEWMLVLACGVFTFLYDFLYLKSLELIPAVEASMLNYLFPIFIVIFAIPIHKEKLNCYKILSMIMGLLGTILLITKGNFTNFSFTNLEGDLLAISAAVSWGLFTNLVKKNKKDMLMSTFVITLVAWLLAIVGMLVYSQGKLLQMVDFYGVLWLCLSNIVFGFFLYFRALKYSSASLIASFTFFAPFVTLVFIMLLLGERLTWMDGLSAILILFSVPVQRVGEVIHRRKGIVI
ncbi:drug/metabolite transporter (DMT)-like permease [Paenibacillus qinlingensis]|uniref:Drug/metabolite transporter (DMT)-like permease n=1 Tax=Paenibacillus qinlingensis TaxID=1837343 RepID=A0ABU1NSC1_9BACL|nr:drug/metabolite transporter (DMT)-like permease [Paenibacillus qinlingensis]